jgi:ribulose-phosphate 3-epimerase
VGWAEWTAGRVTVEPSIYAADFAHLGDELDVLLGAGARVFQFDVGDGHFIQEITTGPVVLRAIADRVHSGGGVFDCHLMVSEPEQHFESIRRAGGDSVTFHVEAVDDPARAARAARELGLAVGVAFNPDTAVADAVAAVEAAEADVALCMSIHPGLSGQALLAEAPARIALLRASVSDTVLVQVDGGVSASNVAELVTAGADLIVAGSAICWQDDPARAYRELDAAANAAEATR